MARGQLPKAYLRLDPNLDQTHEDPGAYVRLLCAAARQPRRGRFASRRILEAAVGRRIAVKSLERGDVLEREGGSLEVREWDVLQEGDVTVGERMRRLRQVRELGDYSRNSSVTEAQQDRISPSEASRRLGVKASDETDTSPPPTPASSQAGADAPEPAAGAAVVTMAARRSKAPRPKPSAPSLDTPENRAPIDAYNETFGTRVGYTTGNLRASARTLSEGYALEDMKRVFVAVQARASPTAEWCADHNREFEYLIRPAYKHHKTHELVQGPLDKIPNELATGRRSS